MMSKVWLVQHISDDYEDSWSSVGIYSSQEKAMEAVYVHAEHCNRNIEIRPRDGREDDIIYQEHYKTWNDDIEDYVWDGESWTDAGNYGVYGYELDQLPTEAE